MKDKNYFQGKDVLVVGFGKSGLSSANLLYTLGANVKVTDNQDNVFTRNNLNALKSKEILVELGKHSKDLLQGVSLLVISPGVPNDSFPILWAKDLNIPIISEIELGFLFCPAKVIAITGTCGKTTVTTLLGRVFEAAGKRAFTCGNIGNPFTQELGKMKEGDYVFLEVSSFQLEYIDKFKPKVSVILNISRNHLDRHTDMHRYIEAKARIFKNQDKSDFLVLNYDDEVARGLASKAKAKIAYFKQEDALNPNQSAVLAVSRIFGIEDSIVKDTFLKFKGVEHRMEEVLEIKGVKFINDSKATTTEATVWALNSLSSPAVLIAGGREKGNDYSRVLEVARDKIKAMVLIGESKDAIKKEFGNFFDTYQAETLEEAVDKAFSLALSGECVLFSPMCKSFDMFLNYEARGRAFKEAVRKLA
ncbi:MAG: Mur ligase family protein [Candidatus Omnitrophota bacterium]